MPSPKILETFQGDRRAFLANLFKQSRKAKTWFSIDLGKSRFEFEGIARADCACSGFFGREANAGCQSRGRAESLSPIASLRVSPSLADKLHAKLAECEQRNLERLHHLLELVSAEPLLLAIAERIFRRDSLRTLRPLRLVFGREPGRRSPRTTGRGIGSFPPVPGGSSSPPASRSCGNPKPSRGFLRVTSPQLTAAKLSSDPLFGAAAHVPFAEVMAAVGSSARTAKPRKFRRDRLHRTGTGIGPQIHPRPGRNRPRQQALAAAAKHANGPHQQ